MAEKQLTRREILKKAAYVAPVIVTAKANFAFASAGSGDYADETKHIEYLGRGDEKDAKKKKHKKENADNNDKKNWTNKTRFLRRRCEVTVFEKIRGDPFSVYR